MLLNGLAKVITGNRFLQPANNGSEGVRNKYSQLLKSIAVLHDSSQRVDYLPDLSYLFCH